MSKNKTKTVETIPEKKLNLGLVEGRLEEAFSDLKSLVSKKKFERGIKKAAKLINKDFPKKSLDSFRKQHEAPVSETEIVEDSTSELIDELP